MKRYSMLQLVLEPYKGRGKIEAQVSSGFATVKQKTNLVGLRLLEDANVIYGTERYTVPKGSKVYFTEETLHSSPWAKKVFTSDFMKEQFILAEPSAVVFINESEKA